MLAVVAGCALQADGLFVLATLAWLVNMAVAKGFVCWLDSWAMSQATVRRGLRPNDSVAWSFRLRFWLVRQDAPYGSCVKLAGRGRGGEGSGEELGLVRIARLQYNLADSGGLRAVLRGGIGLAHVLPPLRPGHPWQTSRPILLSVRPWRRLRGRGLRASGFSTTDMHPRGRVMQRVGDAARHRQQLGQTVA